MVCFWPRAPLTEGLAAAAPEARKLLSFSWITPMFAGDVFYRPQAWQQMLLQIDNGETNDADDKKFWLLRARNSRTHPSLLPIVSITFADSVPSRFPKQIRDGLRGIGAFRFGCVNWHGNQTIIFWHLILIGAENFCFSRRAFTIAKCCPLEVLFKTRFAPHFQELFIVC